MSTVHNILVTREPNFMIRSGDVIVPEGMIVLHLMLFCDLNPSGRWHSDNRCGKPIPFIVNNWTEKSLGWVEERLLLSCVLIRGVAMKDPMSLVSDRFIVNCGLFKKLPGDLDPNKSMSAYWASFSICGDDRPSRSISSTASIPAPLP